jgi:hypothetical protein
MSEPGQNGAPPSELFERQVVRERAVDQTDASTIGDAGELLVCAHLQSVMIECGIIKGRNIDVVAVIDGRFMRIQVKSSVSKRRFGGNDAFVTDNRNSIVVRGLSSYCNHVDAFAFCYLPDPYPYYIAAPAISTNFESLSPSCFTKYGRDRSFAELLRRFRGEPA